MQSKSFQLLLFSLFLINFWACKNDKQSGSSINQSTEIEKITEQPSKVIDIVTRSMEFQMADTIPSGWNTFKYDNRANETHFFRFVKLPEGYTLENYKNEVDPIFEAGMDLINEGKPDEGFAEFGKLPEWFNKGIPYGGSGLIAPKHQTLTTLNLDSGLYAMECYVKMPNGKFHSTMGMVKEVYVTQENSNFKPPTSTDTITIKADGFHFDKGIKNGKHIFQVNIQSQKLHENFALTDVHLAKLDNMANLDSLEAWMVWYNPKGFITPVPNGVTFLGGYNDAMEGTIGYFHADLKPGKYILLAEVPNAREKGLLQEFEVLE